MKELASARDAESERTRDRPAPDEALRLGAPDAVTATLALQRAVGNRATTQLLARRKPKTPQEAGHNAVVKRRWGDAVSSLSWMDQADEQAVLHGLTADDLRTLHFRTGSAAPGKDKRLQQDIRAEYTSRNIEITHGTGISGDGQVMVQVGPIKHGQPGALDPDDEEFSYPVTVSYLPPPNLKGVDQIAWIQTVRNVEHGTGANRSPHGAKRLLPDFTKVDRLTGKKQGWYGMEDSGKAQGNMHKWEKGDKDPAWMWDAPSATDADQEYFFVAAAVVRQGKKKGKVLATVEWGFDVDANLRITAKPTTITNLLTQQFKDAVGKWNEQADLPNKADRNAPKQVKFPTLK